MTTRIVKQDPSHAEGLWHALANPRIYSFLDDHPPPTPERLRERIVGLQRGHSPDGSQVWFNWTVFHDGRIVGYTQATLMPDQSASIAYVLSPEMWGKGVGHDACRQMLGLLQQSVSPLAYTADTMIENTRSRRLLERLGFSLARETETEVFYRATPEALATAAG